MNNNPNRLPALLLLLVAAVGVPGAAAFTFAEQVTQHPWAALGLAFFYELLVLITSLVTKVWERLESEWVDAIAGWLKTQLRLTAPGYSKKYLQYLIYRHRDFDVKGLTTLGIYTLELELVFVELSIVPRPIHETSADPIHPVAEEVRGRRSIWDYLNAESLQEQHLAMIGAPGSGKTTLLKHLTLTLAGPRKQRGRVNAPNKLPILLFLRDHVASIRESSEFALFDAIRNDLSRKKGPLPPQGWFQAQLDAGHCLVLFDGLDEVADIEDRKAVAAWVETQMVAFPRNRFVITSRPHGYRTNPLSGVTVLEVQPFNQEQVERFVHNWYRTNEIMSSQKDDPGVLMRAQEGAEDLLLRLYNSPTLAALAVNPLLLTMIATVHRYRSSLPGRRVDLYAEICEVFLGKRRQAVGLDMDLRPAQKQRVLQPLAYCLMRSKRRELSVDEAGQLVAEPLAQVTGKTGEAVGREFLAMIEETSGLLLERETGVYSFAHLAFQEYLTAVHVKEQGLEKALVQRVDDPWWHETIRLHAAQSDATAIVAACLADASPPVQTLALANECIEEGREVAPELRNRLQRVLEEGVEDGNSERRRVVAEVLLELRLRRLVRVDEGKYIDPMYISHAEYQLFLDEKRIEGVYYQPDHWTDARFPQGEGLTPVVGVRASDAIAFCEWLGQRETAGWYIRLPNPDELSGYNSPPIPQHGTARGYWVKTTDGVVLEKSGAPFVVSRAMIERQIREDLDLTLVDAATVARDFARALDRVLDRDPVLDLARPWDLDLTHVLDRSRTRALDRDLALALDRDPVRDPVRDLIRDLAFARDRDLVRARAFRISGGMMSSLRWYIRIVAIMSFVHLHDYLQTTRLNSRWWRLETVAENQIKHLEDEYLALYADFAFLEARIRGELSALESIRIVREKVSLKVINSVDRLNGTSREPLPLQPS